MQRCFSASATQENGSVMRGPLREVGSEGGVEGGLQVAMVKVSTSLRIKKRGKVPPRLETLDMLVRYRALEVAETYVASRVI